MNPDVKVPAYSFSSEDVRLEKPEFKASVGYTLSACCSL